MAQGEPISAKIEVAGVRPATFRLRWKAKDSYDLYRGSRKLGTARVEEAGDWTAKFEHGGKRWHATGESGQDLLHLVGTFVLAQEGRSCPPPTSDVPEDGVSAAERKLGEKWRVLQEKRRVARLDKTIREARQRITPLKR